MTRETTYLGMVGGWQKLLGAIGANEDLAHQEVPRAKLEELLTQAQGVITRQAALTAAKQEASKELQGIIVEGERLARALRRMIQAQYGPRAEKLAEFGLQPFRGRNRKAAAKPSPEAPPPAPPVPPAAADSSR
jgi:hypothetical protein